MIFTNTSKYPTEEVNKLVRLATKGLRKQIGSDQYKHLSIMVTNCSRQYRGRAWNSYRYRILVRIGAESQFPVRVQYPRKKTAPIYEFKTWQEALFGVTVHEARHCYQFAKKKGCSEIDAERQVVKRLERYRSKQ